MRLRLLVNLSARLDPRCRLLDGATGRAQKYGELLGLVSKNLMRCVTLRRQQSVHDFSEVTCCVVALTCDLAVKRERITAAKVAELAARFLRRAI